MKGILETVDATDFFTISPMYGTILITRSLADDEAQANGAKRTKFQVRTSTFCDVILFNPCTRNSLNDYYGLLGVFTSHTDDCIFKSFIVILADICVEKLTWINMCRDIY